ncbi:trehalose-phosphatase [Pontimonas sp.]|nr:trehalose-phosphatase [Pontimonas sp.]
MTLSHVDPVLVALDFDGTLAPLVDDPEESRMLHAARTALTTLTYTSGITVALVSGRAIDSLLVVADPLPEWFLVGSHGGEMVPPGHHHSYMAESAVPPELDQVFLHVVTSHPGTRLERKAFGLALHTRGVESKLARKAEQAAREVCDAFPADLSVRTGHGIVECSLLHASKADGVIAVVEVTGAKATLFAGDDNTDEDAISVLSDRDVGIWVGPGESAAPYRLVDSVEVARVLELLVELSGHRR